jgi:hypothetical protein
MISDKERALAQIFHPYFAEQYIRVSKSNGRFVHYTSAEAAMNMLANKSIWMRNVRLMNDFSETQYGLDLLVSAYKGPIGDRLKTCLSKIDDAICTDVEKLFDGWSPRFREVTYLTCFSEHDGGEEDLIGRLSMWRAYGGSTSVALVLNNGPFLAPTDVIPAYASPVLYANKSRFDDAFEHLTNNLENAVSYLINLGCREVHDRLFNAFLFAALCTKHPGFGEEREWRVIHTEQMHPSTNLTKEIETIKGVPQFVYKIPLRDIAGEGGQNGFHGAKIEDLVDLIIIGPSESGLAMRDAFIHLLDQSGISDASNKVRVSGIPLRAS